VSYGLNWLPNSCVAASSDVALEGSAAPAAGAKCGYGAAKWILPLGLVEIVYWTCRDPLTGSMVTAARTPTGRSRSGRRDVLGEPVVGNLQRAGGHVNGGRYSAVAVASKSRCSGGRLHQPSPALACVGADLVVDPLNPLASGGG
jgi:hypothetical protein